MKRAILLMVLIAQSAFTQPTKQGKWLDTTADTKSLGFTFSTDGRLLLTEDYEVNETHEVCASLTGYFLEKSQLGRYEVGFKGMRTSAQFVFTTQYDAEKWVEKFCTPRSLRSIKAGDGGSLRRAY